MHNGKEMLNDIQNIKQKLNKNIRARRYVIIWLV